jgi:hypothetical protein
MKEPHSEDPASHTGPESCGCGRKVASEALTGENAGRVLSHEMLPMGAPTQWTPTEGKTVMSEMASASQAPRGRRPRACVDTSYAGSVSELEARCGPRSR